MVGLIIQTVKSPFDAKRYIPFYSWFLFDKVPNKSATIELKLLSSGEKVFDPPLAFNKAKGIVTNPRSTQARLVIQKIGEALVRGNINEAERLRRLFEKVFLKIPAKYELVLVTYDPLERWKNARVDTKILKTFDTEK